ncbi:uncharacterized protein [Macrobrachium rosenbergii]|uniref:uncharacterized protein n=1 Tax=Macrobrachium rosenbergii TaxID=79674 RepID=UPI0034D556EF
MEGASTASCAEPSSPVGSAVLESQTASLWTGVQPSCQSSRSPWPCLMGASLHSTMAYNPAVNGMVERAHCSLKAAPMARCTDERWKEQLPWSCWVSALHQRTTTYSPTALHSFAYVFVRVNARQPPLTRPYRGPHRVIRRAATAYLLDIHSQEDWITIDMLKPAFLLDSEVHEEEGRHPRVPSVPPRRHTCSPTKAESRAAQETH